MSLEKIDQYIKELEAIKYYDEVDKERTEALRTIDKLEESHEADIDRLDQAKTKLYKRLDKFSDEKESLAKENNEKGKEIDRLRGSLKIKDDEVRRINLEADVLKNRVEKHEELKGVVEGKTLGEAEKAFLKAKEVEIERRAEEHFNSMKAEWKKSEKPNEVLNNAVRLLRNIIENLEKPGPKIFLKKLADLELPKKVEEIIKSEVDKRRDIVFEQKVEEESSRKASVKLEQMLNKEWPNWFNLNVEQRARDLESRINTNVLALLKGPWIITCDKCDREQSVELTPQRLEFLLRHGYAKVECENPNCKNWRRQKIKLDLDALISEYITRGLER